MENNVKIPKSLFYTVFYMLEDLYVCVTAGDITLPKGLSKQYEAALLGFREKNHTMNVHAAYSAITTANTEQERDICRKRYVYMKQGMSSFDALSRALRPEPPSTVDKDLH